MASSKLDNQAAQQNTGGNPNATGPVSAPIQYQCADAFDGTEGNGLVDEVSDEGDYKAGDFKGRFGDGK